MSYVIPLGEDSWKLAPGFLWILFPALLPFADFALAVLNHSYTTICQVSLVFPVNHRTWGVLGDPDASAILGRVQTLIITETL